MTLENTQITLAARPVGVPKDSDWATVRGPVEDPGPGEVLVETLYLSIDPAMRGWMNDVRSYVRPVGIGEVMRSGGVGRVLKSGDGAAHVAGQLVYGMLGWQRYATRPADKLIPLPADGGGAPLTAYLGVLGIPGLSAYFGLLDIGQPKAGETVLVSAAAGAVGSVVAQIAKIKGCRVAGIAGGPDKCRFLTEELGLDAAIDYKGDERMRDGIKRACPDGVDVYFDNVGGPILDAALRRINHGARIVICGAIHHYNATEAPRGPANYLSLLVNRARMEGFVIFDFADRYDAARAELAGWMKAGKLRHQAFEVEGLENAPAALLRLFTGDKLGKLVVKVAD